MKEIIEAKIKGLVKDIKIGDVNNDDTLQKIDVLTRLLSVVKLQDRDNLEKKKEVVR